MQVETFECQETATETTEISQEAIALVERLNLAGQLSLIDRSSDIEVPQRCPYRQMKADEQFVYTLLCPNKESVDHYAGSPIPLRVLQVLEHAKSLNIFESFHIWSAEGQIKDPVLVAMQPVACSTWSKLVFILARWGDKLDAFSQLATKAGEIQRGRFKTALIRRASMTRNDLELLDNLPADSFIGKSVPSTYSELS
jgi:hypothetical protein